MGSKGDHSVTSCVSQSADAHTDARRAADRSAAAEPQVALY